MPDPYQFGAKGDGVTDDTAALTRWVKGGGGEIPAGTFRFNGPLRYDSGFKISRWEGKLLYGEGWASGYALCARDITGTTHDVRIDASAGGELIYYGQSDRPRKGIGLTWIDGFELINPTVLGGAGDKGVNLFSAEVRGSRRGKIRGGRLSVLSGQQGADGIHFLENCSDIEVIELSTLSGDDSVGLTVEIPNKPQYTMERITFTRCKLDNVGHSSIKVVLTSIALASAIRDITFQDCAMRTTLHPLGAGVPAIIYNHNVPAGARIDRLSIIGGTTEVVIPDGGLQGGTAFQLQAANDIHLIKHDVRYWSRTVMEAWDCKGLVVEGGRFEAIKPLPKIDLVPQFRLRNCPDAHIAPALARPTWTDQLVVAKPA